MARFTEKYFSKQIEYSLIDFKFIAKCIWWGLYYYNCLSGRMGHSIRQQEEIVGVRWVHIGVARAMVIAFFYRREYVTLPCYKHWSRLRL